MMPPTDNQPSQKWRLARLPLFALAIGALLAAMWAGQIRIGWPWPVRPVTLPQAHGSLMIAGFLGTLISLERAVAIGRGWSYLAPAFSGIGSLLLILAPASTLGPLLITLGSLGLVLVMGHIALRHPAMHTAIMAWAAVLWLIGNGLWLAGWAIHRVVFWWLAFLVLTIAAERLELSRVLRLPPLAHRLFQLAAAAVTAGVLLTTFNYDAGVRLTGLALIGLAAWLLRYDLARRNIRREGLTRYIATCLLSGYFWLALGGLLALSYGHAAGVYYDAMLHAVLVGFVMAMIFGHAPIIFPAVLQIPVNYRPSFYLPLALLNVSLILRVAGDLFLWPTVRRWGGLLNMIAVLLFLGLVITSVRFRDPATQAPK